MGAERQRHRAFQTDQILRDRCEARENWRRQTANVSCPAGLPVSWGSQNKTVTIQVGKNQPREVSEQRAGLISSQAFPEGFLKEW